MIKSQATLGLIDHFSTLADPRQAWKVIYPLPEIMLTILAATLASADDFVEIEEWGNENLAFLRGFLAYADGIPSHDALNDLVNALDADVFKSCFSSWVATLADAAPTDVEGCQCNVVSLDGKTSRRTHARSKGRNPLHLVAAWAARQRLVLGQQAVDEKSNEITAIPHLLERLELKGALVTIDAMGTQTDIAQAIVDKGADYCLALKGNHPLLHAEVERFFADPTSEGITTSETTDGDQGRIETRIHSVCHDVAWLFSDRRYADEPTFPSLAMIGMIERITEGRGQGRGQGRGETEHTRHYYLSSAKLDAVTFGRAVRAHWGIENRLHWVLDVVFHDDLSRLRSGNGPQNMAIVKHMAMNLLRATKPTASLKVRRKKAGWNTSYLKAVLSGAA
jgi:predicted transposase YbfD/YdcC